MSQVKVHILPHFDQISALICCSLVVFERKSAEFMLEFKWLLHKYVKPLNSHLKSNINSVFLYFNTNRGFHKFFNPVSETYH